MASVGAWVSQRIQENPRATKLQPLAESRCRSVGRAFPVDHIQSREGVATELNVDGAKLLTSPEIPIEFSICRWRKDGPI
jgi:hypothetical protein